MDRKDLFVMLYALAAREGREASLFGKTMRVAREAFARGLCGSAFPEVWFEVPLAGEPWFDLHLGHDRRTVCGDDAFAGLGEAYQKALRWFGASANTRQLFLSFDTSGGSADRPAVQMLRNGSDLAATMEFLEAMGRPDLCDAYRAFISNVPAGWYACYTGVFPPRNDSDWVRVECIVGGDAQGAYAQDPNTLRAHLARLGMDATNDELVRVVRMLAQTPFPLELQFNVGHDGRALPTLGASVRFSPQNWLDGSSKRAIEKIFAQVESIGLADERWRCLAQTAFAKRISKGDELVHLWCYPAFVKLRWRDGRPLDAKSYLVAGASVDRP